MNPRDKASLLDIVDAAQLTQSFIEGMKQQDFLDDIKTQSAVIYQIAIIGEATKRLSTDFRQKHPHIPWNQIAGMRDKLIHDYNGTDLSRIWSVLQSSIPELIEAVSLILKEIEIKSAEEKPT
ncbi:MAG: DUF86 domain-containing protein [Cyanobacteria bacterium J06581_3]